MQDISQQKYQQYVNPECQLQQSFKEIVKQYFQKGGLFLDKDNPLCQKAEWFNFSISNPNYKLFEQSKSTKKDSKKTGLQLQANDIKQGQLNDCYFLSSVASLVSQYPELIQKLFVLLKNNIHLYGVRLFINGKWSTIFLDTQFPRKQSKFYGATPSNKQTQIWVMLLEKAWAKVNGSYDTINQGSTLQSLTVISGAPSIYLNFSKNNFQRQSLELKDGEIATCTTSQKVRNMSQIQQKEKGIYKKHSYSLLQIYTNLKNKDNENIKIFKLRNPWGEKNSQDNMKKGQWNSKSINWSVQLKNKVDFSLQKNGIFYMSQNEFFEYFESIQKIKIHPFYSNSYIDIVKSNRLQFKATKINIVEKGDYYFTIYPNRQPGNNQQKSWIFLFKSQNQDIQPISSSCKKNMNNTLLVSLQVGQYTLVSRLQQKQQQMNECYTISCYGINKVKFNKIEYKSKMIEQYIKNRCKNIIWQINQLGIYQKSYIDSNDKFNIDEGYAFIGFKYRQDQSKIIKIYDMKGLQIVRQNQKGINVQFHLQPGRQEFLCFVIDPDGFSLTKESEKGKKAHNSNHKYHELSKQHKHYELSKQHKKKGKK